MTVPNDLENDGPIIHYRLVGQVKVTSPRYGTQIYELVRYCDLPQIQDTRYLIRETMLRDLADKDLIFGCTIGAFTLRQQPWTLAPMPSSKEY